VHRPVSMPILNQQTSLTLKVVMAQVNPLVGDIHGNTALVLEQAQKAISDHQAEVVVFPELVLTAYPPEDLLLRPSLDARIDWALQELQDAALPTVIVVGYPGRQGDKLQNRLVVINHGQILGSYIKQRLPNYQVFDEKRYFKKGREPLVLNLGGINVGFTICEDLWKPKPMALAKAAGAELMININGSPYHQGKLKERQQVMSQRVHENNIPLLYINQVGGQDELVFDGASMAMNAEGEILVQAPQYHEALTPVKIVKSTRGVEVVAGEKATPLAPVAELYETLVLGLRDYVNKNRFPSVVLGLSGGIDSALTMALAVDALGAERVKAVMMPFAYTSDMSKEDAQLQATRQQVSFEVLPIETPYEAFISVLENQFAGTEQDLTEQNLQARCRGVLLMALSNKQGSLVLTTGNKSELAVGYSTLYGDMAGGFDVIKDVPKMQVYALAKYRNERDGTEVIPSRVINRPPSAELAPGQVDEDNLPPYEILDQILELYIEQDLGVESICAQGFDAQIVKRVILMVDRNEYKRRQAPVGVRISRKAFGRDRRYPIINGWRL
jgi:NAD+ synthase (glutamine-hydrolysing)